MVLAGSSLAPGPVTKKETGVVFSVLAITVAVVVGTVVLSPTPPSRTFSMTLYASGPDATGVGTVTIASPCTVSVEWTTSPVAFVQIEVFTSSLDTGPLVGGNGPSGNFSFEATLSGAYTFYAVWEGRATNVTVSGTTATDE